MVITVTQNPAIDVGARAEWGGILLTPKPPRGIMRAWAVEM
jgi:hypothetical protein